MNFKRHQKENNGLKFYSDKIMLRGLEGGRGFGDIKLF